MKIVRPLLSALVVLSVLTVAAPAAHAAIIDNCDRADEHDFEVRYQDNCVMADTPPLPPVGDL